MCFEELYFTREKKGVNEKVKDTFYNLKGKPRIELT
jgi:hypothetical protein